ncbi:MAG: hypothetical protein QY325_04070 [Flavobacteriales bacterium]|nr:MAG: hypothetical protein QY325_04070 [Flavobacteriales bacterium]
MRRAATISFLALIACGSPEERTAIEALRTGARAYADSAYARADSAFASAPWDERAVFNRGNANLMMGRYEQAIAHFKVAGTMDSSAREQSRIRFNLGSVSLAEARDADTSVLRMRRQLGQLRIEGQDIARDVATFVLRDSLTREADRLEGRIDSAYAAAIAHYKSALRIAPHDDDARHDLVLAQQAFAKRQRERAAREQRDRQKEKDTELGARARLIMQQADSLVERYRFRPALELLQKGLQQDPSLRTKQEYMQKLETVNEAAQAQ